MSDTPPRASADQASNQASNQASHQALADATIGSWLDQLGSSAPAPGGGAAAAMCTATGAALVGMVANLTIGRPAFAEHETHSTTVRAQAEELRTRALELASADAAAFTDLMATYRLPRSTDAERAERSAATQQALLAATEVSLDIATAAAEVVRLAKSLHGRSNPAVLSDVAVAAAAAAAGLESAAVNAEVNLRSIRDADVKARLTTATADRTAQLATARDVVASIRQEFTA
jgi:methenyltetrahydrofolate cyclohydrolase